MWKHDGIQLQALDLKEILLHILFCMSRVPNLSQTQIWTHYLTLIFDFRSDIRIWICIWNVIYSTIWIRHQITNNFKSTIWDIQENFDKIWRVSVPSLNLRKVESDVFQLSPVHHWKSFRRGTGGTGNTQDNLSQFLLRLESELNLPKNKSD